MTQPVGAAGRRLGAWGEWRSWRPMGFGSRLARTVRDPVIEPLWPGRRVLVGLGRASTLDGAAGTSPALSVRDEAGLELAGPPEVHAALLDAAGAAGLVLDGYFVELPRRDTPAGRVTAPVAVVPGIGALARQLMLGGGATRLAPAVDRAAGAGDPGLPVAATVPPGSPAVTAFVAVDLLAVDDEVLLDVPLVERRRVLEAVVAAGERVRRGPYVRPPAESWYGQWRALGFREVAVKSANGRYAPGETSPDWAIARIPRG
jgi:hypothetical protein